MNKIARKLKTIENKIDKLEAEIANIQENCPHENLTYKYCGSTGHYDRSDDAYWMIWKCQDCKKQWQTSQNDAYNLKTNVYPQAKRVKSMNGGY